MDVANNNNTNGFQGRVLTELEYIRKKQERHDTLMDKLFDKLETRYIGCDKRFDEINKKINRAEGFAKGAMAMGGSGILGSILSFFRFLK